MLNGSAVEYLPLIKSDSALLTVGPVVGTMIREEGTRPYADLEIRGRMIHGGHLSGMARRLATDAN